MGHDRITRTENGCGPAISAGADHDFPRYGFPCRERSFTMNTIKTRVMTLCLFAAIAGVSGTASAKGCLTGAAVGGAAGHVAGKHGVIGAAAGCAVGRHRANKKAEQKAAANTQQNQNAGRSNTTSSTPATTQ
jgi:hypothetical protein